MGEDGECYSLILALTMCPVPAPAPPLAPGMVAGPAIQLACYSLILARTDWEAESRQAITDALSRAQTAQPAARPERQSQGAQGGVGADPAGRAIALKRSPGGRPRSASRQDSFGLSSALVGASRV